MLDETKQIQLGKVIPLGTNETKTQKRIRAAINEQKRELYNLHQKPLGNVESISNELLSKNLPTWKIRYGISPILKQYRFENAYLHPEETRAIVLVIPMNFQKMQSVPSLESATEIMDSYARTGSTVHKVTKLLRDKGIQATGHHPLGDRNDYHHLLFPPHAVKAGLGEKGRTGLFIDHKLGPMVRLGIVTTSLALPCGSQVDRGINAFCHRCRYCVNYCPPRAINPRKYLESLRIGKPIIFKINVDSCFKYFEKHNGCGKCLVKCVLAQPDELAVTKRMNRIENWYKTWVVSGEIDKLHQETIVQQN